MSKKKKKKKKIEDVFRGVTASFSSVAAVDVILRSWLALPGCVIPAGGDGHGTGSVYILPREHLVFIRLFKNPPQPLRPDWRVACIGARCLPAGHRSEDTHTHTL